MSVVDHLPPLGRSKGAGFSPTQAPVPWPCMLPLACGAFFPPALSERRQPRFLPMAAIVADALQQLQRPSAESVQNSRSLTPVYERVTSPPMIQTSRPLRPRFLRLLASLLVVVSLLGNGLALSASTMKGCCAQMMGQHGADKGDCDQGGKPCPSPGASCSEQCLVRCHTSLVLPVVAWTEVLGPGGHTRSSPVFVVDRPLADPGPGLRPPISA